MTYTIEQASPPACGFTRRQRTEPVSQVQIHTTRGPGVPENRQLGATVNWFADCDAWPNGNDKGGWGGSADFVIGPDAAQGNAIRIVQFGDWLHSFSSWSAGYGSQGPSGDHGAAEVGVAIEIAQEKPGDPIDPRSIEAAAWLCREVIMPRLEATGQPPIPPKRLHYWDQSLARAVPRGFIGHEDLENGHRLGKSDPGPRFPWVEFLKQVAGAPAPSPAPASAVTLSSVLSQDESAERTLLGWWGALGHRATYEERDGEKRMTVVWR